MTERLELAQKIHDFLDAHAKIAAAYDPEYDDPGERFNGPDSSMLYAAAERLKADVPFQMPFSSWGSGCYKPVHDQEAKAKHDEILAELRVYLDNAPTAPAR
ncbi:hypothetical protein [Rhizobium sp. MHM7A]|uniref:hypothetical protein n=1 Tax=Rhizobium sp. MHM7A TaxID=2583233 RepID=UPI001106EBA8|nr:hypothetical protein [Rhizobium sp. MHM7A]TLX16542.1 hypothetical protein FFR93_04180 [Rhizobium sp. MHM7A]